MGKSKALGPLAMSSFACLPRVQSAGGHRAVRTGPIRHGTESIVSQRTTGLIGSTYSHPRCDLVPVGEICPWYDVMDTAGRGGELNMSGLCPTSPEAMGSWGARKNETGRGRIDPGNEQTNNLLGREHILTVQGSPGDRASTYIPPVLDTSVVDVNVRRHKLQRFLHHRWRCAVCASTTSPSRGQVNGATTTVNWSVTPAYIHLGCARQRRPLPGQT